MNIDKFVQDHQAIGTAVNELRALVKSGVAANAPQIVDKLVAMSSRIKLHLAAEDGFLYPALIGSTRAPVADVGKRFQSEMGAIAGVYSGFATKWSNVDLIKREPERFRDEANQIFKTLHERIQRENTELYPLARQA